VGRPSGVLQGFMVHCIIVVVYSADCCGSVALLCSICDEFKKALDLQ